MCINLHGGMRRVPGKRGKEHCSNNSQENFEVLLKVYVSIYRMNFNLSDNVLAKCQSVPNPPFECWFLNISQCIILLASCDFHGLFMVITKINKEYCITRFLSLATFSILNVKLKLGLITFFGVNIIVLLVNCVVVSWRLNAHG